MAKKTTAISSVYAGPSKAEQARYQAEDDLRTMQRFQELKSNPSRMRQVETHLKKQMQAVQSVKGRKP